MSLITEGAVYRSEITGLFYKLEADAVMCHTGSAFDAWSPADFGLPMLERLVREDRIYETVSNYNLNRSKL